MKKANVIILFLLFSAEKIIAQQTEKIIPNIINVNRDSLKRELAKEKNDIAKVDLLDVLAWAYIFEYEDTATFYASQGLELSRKADYKVGEGNHLSKLCLSLFLSGDYTSALKYGLDYLSFAKDLNDTLRLVNAYDLLGLCYREQEDYNEALKYLHTAEPLSRSLHFEPGELNLRGSVLGNIGSVYERSGRLDSALHYCEKAYEITR